MFRAGLLLIIRRINSVYTANGIVMRYVEWLLPTARKHKRMTIPIALYKYS